MVYQPTAAEIALMTPAERLTASQLMITSALAAQQTTAITVPGAVPTQQTTAITVPGGAPKVTLPAYSQVSPTPSLPSILPAMPTMPGSSVTPGGEPILFGGAILLGIWIVRHAAAIAAMAFRFGWSVTKAIAWIRRNVWAIAKAAGWVAAGVWLSNALDLSDAEGEKAALEIAGEGEPKRHKRYTLGHNPRVKTLAKVARHVQKLLKRHEKVLREFFPKPSRRGELAAREKAHHRLIAKVAD